MTNPIEQAAGALLKHRLGVLAPRPIDLLSIRRLAPIEVLLSCEHQADDDGLSSDCRMLSPELADDRRRIWNDASVEHLVHLAPELGRDSDHPSSSQLNLLAYSVTPRWEQLAARSPHFRMIGPPAALKALLDNKIWVRSRLSSSGLPVPDSRPVATNDLDFKTLSREFDAPFIVQTPVGHSGVGTSLIRDPKELATLKQRGAQNSEWLVSTFSGLCTVNVHALNTGDETLVSVPSVQLTGIPELSSTFARYCGNDFGAIKEMPRSTRDEITRLVHAIGVWLDSLNYTGLFGVDLVVNGGAPQVLEINARFQGSTWLLDEIELEADRVPLSVRHFLRSLGERSAYPGPGDEPSDGAHMILHWCGNSPLTITHRVRRGIYALDQRGNLAFRRVAPGLLECDEDEFVVYGFPPRPKATVAPQAILARMATRTRVGSADGRSLTDFGRRILNAVSNELLDTSDRLEPPFRSAHASSA